MNSRSGVNESNLVNFSTELSTLNQLDTKDALLTFPFDHLYACHSESDRRQALQLDKEVEISTHCVIGEDKELVIGSNPEVCRLSERLTALESQNKKLKDLLIYHLDLIQQQNELLSKREKLYQGLKLENESLKAKLNRLDRRIAVNQKHSINPPPLVQVPSSTVTSSTLVDHDSSSSSQIMLNSFQELLLPDSRRNPLIFDSDLTKSKSFEQDSFELTNNSEADVTNYLSSDLGVSSILDSNLCDEFTMIENKRTFKKQFKTENRPDSLYTVTSNSGNPVFHRIQRNRKRTSSGIGSLNRISRTPINKVELPESSKLFGDDKNFDRTYSVNKKSKTINTYGKSKVSNAKKTPQFTGSLSDRLQLIDTTPTGEDPYQLGEADMREQSPIPKLMLQKTSHGRTKPNTDEKTSRNFFNSTLSEGESKASSKFNDRYNLTNTYRHPSEIKTETMKSVILDGLTEKQESAINWQLFDSTKPSKVESKTLLIDEPDLGIIKTEPEIDWRMYNPNKPVNETSLCDFSYGETTNFASNTLPTLDSVEFQELFNDSQLQLNSSLNSNEYNSEKNGEDKLKRRAGRTTSMLGTNFLGEEQQNRKMCVDSKRGRKRALSTTGLMKNVKHDLLQKGNSQKPKIGKGRASSRGKKSPVPGMVTRKPYYTSVGDPDLSWYLGLDPDVKIEDVDQEEKSKVSTVEVPRWREKPYTSCYTLEGTENLDDKVFEKRHQKLEAEERRQLRWHMRRIREQRHVERLRQRQRDPWAGGGSPAAHHHQPPPIYTLWPQPQRDAAFIEITDVIPVMAFGEIVPALPASDFMLPWVRMSKALKRAKRSKTLH